MTELLAWTSRRRTPPLSADAIMPGPLVVSGFLSDVTGIGRAGRLTLDAVRQWQPDVVAHDALKDPAGVSLRGLPDGGVWICHCNPPQILELLAAGTDDLWASRFRIGYWAYELPALPRSWHHALAYFHEIWAPSEFVADAIRRAGQGGGPVVKVVPHPLPALHDVAVDRRVLPKPDAFTFLVMFDARSSFARKNPMGALAAFQRAFRRNDASVSLVIKIVAPESDAKSVSGLRKAIEGWSNIALSTEHLPDRQTLSLIASADCLVSLHRAEGFGLTIAESMALGTPAIVTGWSGNMQFCSEGVMEIPFNLVPAADPSGRYAGTGEKWADPNIGSAAEAMVRIRTDAVFRQSLVDRARTLVHERLSPHISNGPYERFLATADAVGGRRHAGSSH